MKESFWYCLVNQDVAKLQLAVQLLNYTKSHLVTYGLKVFVLPPEQDGMKKKLNLRVFA